MRTRTLDACARYLGRKPGAASSLAPVAILAAALMAVPKEADAQTLLTQDEALELAFPAPIEVERRTAYLSNDQLDRARALAGDGVELDQAIVTFYVGLGEAGAATGVAYFDVHRVRTKNEVVMVVVEPDARIRRVDVLKFAEPPEYRAPAGWVQQLEGRPLDEGLSVRSGIRNLTGATLTARALTRAARRILALHTVIDPLGSGR